MLGHGRGKSLIKSNKESEVVFSANGFIPANLANKVRRQDSCAENDAARYGTYHLLAL